MDELLQDWGPIAFFHKSLQDLLMLGDVVLGDIVADPLELLLGLHWEVILGIFYDIFDSQFCVFKLSFLNFSINLF